MHDENRIQQILLPFMSGIFSFIWSILLIYDFFIDTRRSCLCEVGTRVYSSYCLVQVEALIEKNLLFSITISHLMHLLYSSILLIKISAFCSFRVFIVISVLSYKSLSTIFLYQVVTLHPSYSRSNGSVELLVTYGSCFLPDAAHMCESDIALVTLPQRN